MDLYLYDDYKIYLKEYIETLPNSGRGYKLKLAEHLGCKTSFVSQVLSGHLHFSLEQADLINEFCRHSKSESYYFLTLLQYCRSGTESLRKVFKEKLGELRLAAAQIKNRIDAREELAPQDQAQYYSSWHYSAIHVALTIETLSTPEAISKYLNVPVQTINESLEFLKNAGLVERNGGRFEAKMKRIHLGHDSKLIRLHHTNWRVKTVSALVSSDPDKDLHYSSVVSISEKDFEIIRSDLIASIDRAKKKIKESKEETLCSFNIDFFALGKL